MHTPPTRNLLDRSSDNIDPKAPKEKEKEKELHQRSPITLALHRHHHHRLTGSPSLSLLFFSTVENEIDVKEARLNPERLFYFSGKKAFRHHCKNGGRDFFIGIKTSKLY